MECIGKCLMQQCLGTNKETLNDVSVLFSTTRCKCQTRGPFGCLCGLASKMNQLPPPSLSPFSFLGPSRRLPLGQSTGRNYRPLHLAHHVLPTTFPLSLHLRLGNAGKRPRTRSTTSYLSWPSGVRHVFQPTIRSLGKSLQSLHQGQPFQSVDAILFANQRILRRSPWST